jgi:hypothetical protein
MDTLKVFGHTFSFLRSMASYCLVLIMAFLSVGQNLIAASIDSNSSNQTFQDHSSHLYSADHNSENEIPCIYTLFETNSEISEEHSDTCTDTNFLSNGTSLLSNTPTWSSALSYIASMRDRQILSLYVLYHSWQSFLS